jgi:hypothetical protein
VHTVLQGLLAGDSLVGELDEVIGWEAVLVSQHMVVCWAAGALQPGVRVEVERVLKGVLQVDQASDYAVDNPEAESCTCRQST